MFFTLRLLKKRLKSMNKGILVYFYNNSYVISKQQSIFCIDWFSLHPLKQMNVNNTNRITNAGIFSVYASTQMNYLWKMDFPSKLEKMLSLLHHRRNHGFSMCKWSDSFQAKTCNFSIQAFC